MKVLKCADVGFECEGVIRAESLDEVLKQAAAHAKQVHKVECDTGDRREGEGRDPDGIGEGSQPVARAAGGSHQSSRSKEAVGHVT